ncbi:hypothetical protein CK203_008740 [Vitis vinifera]|uniref:Transcription termination factor MTERF6, chloroplastic/mitochondrial n=1 Tax=Vitis vinifera TaxID=29760 RepID=A0A438KD93_VITVI|nr:hypothetical protein CK203_008740 [Vitis vinifera]
MLGEVSKEIAVKGYVALLRRRSPIKIQNYNNFENETAISASGKIHFENPKNPDSVLALLRNSGCFSGAHLASILSSKPSILSRSLENNLIPKYNFLKSVHISNEDAMKVLKRSCWSSSGNLEETIATNIAVLREIGVPISHISFLVVRYHTICQRSDKFSENVKKVVEMGFNPLKFTFLNALQAFCQTTESTRQQKKEIYRRWGWSEDEILLAFRTRPECMRLSEKHVMKVLDFLVNKMGWQPAAVSRDPVAICLNFEKRVVPRCSVVKVLLLKGLVKKDMRSSTFLSSLRGISWINCPGILEYLSSPSLHGKFPVKGRIALLQTKSDQDSELYNFEIGKSLKLPLQMCLKFICERLGLIPKRWQADSTTQLHLLRNTTPFIIRCFSASNQHSFTVSYLVNSCGLSPETAISASEKIHFENPKNPDSVLALLRNSGCTNTHITKIVTKLPSLLLVDPEKTLLPKLEFFCSMGFSSARVASMLSPDPSLLGRSLEKVLIPKYNFLKSVHISNEDAIKVLRRSSWSSSGNLERNIAANIAVLRETGVPISRISYLVTRYHAISLRSDNSVKMSRRRWGWSEDEILSAFRRRPQCMQLSEKKVNKVLDFLVNKMGWQPAVVARAPVAICLNLRRGLFQDFSGILECLSFSFPPWEVPYAIRKHFKTRENPGSKGKFFLEKVLKELPVEGRIALLQTKSDQDSELYDFEIGKSLKLPLQMRLKFICERLGLIPKWWQADSTTQLHFLRNTTPFIIRLFSASNQHSFTVSYLVKSCGLSPETAISASEKIHFENPKNPDSVLALLRDSGCTNTHIAKIVTKLPSLLLVNPEKTLLPKLEFFRSMGLSSADLASILSSEPSILNKSLEKVLIPKHNFLKSVHVNNEGAMKILKRSSWSSSGKTIAANIAVLREIGVPISHISFLVVRYHTICQKSDKFSENVKKVVEMGFNPLKFTFVNALQAFCQMTESTRQQKMEMYRRWGWSEDEIVSAFRSRPQCMQLSEKKVTKVLDFLVNKMGWQPAVVARAPVAICLNFEKRVVPRCSVVKVLLLKGLVKKDLRLDHFLSLTEGNFLDKYVIKYEDDIPQLLDLYQGKLKAEELQSFLLSFNMDEIPTTSCNPCPK